MKYVIVPVLALLMLSTVCPWQDKKTSSALDAMVQSERDFAKTSVEKGIRDSFIEFFAEDGINFQPGPTKTKEAFLSRPAPAQKPTNVLNWEPIYADMASSGDLGYTTGPYTNVDNGPDKRPTRYGYYFSIWKRQADGTFKVAVDCGIQTPVPNGPQTLKLQTGVPAKGKLAIPGTPQETGRAELLTFDKEFLRNAESQGLMYAYGRYLSGDARMHRNGFFPFVDRAGIQTYLKMKPIAMKWWPMKSDVSIAGDLGYTYGNYEISDPSTKKVTEKGYYVRVWKRDLNGTWNLVLDTTNPLSPGQ